MTGDQDSLILIQLTANAGSAKEVTIRLLQVPFEVKRSSKRPRPGKKPKKGEEVIILFQFFVVILKVRTML